eukprot:9035540-Pyramimonas_sp.AAC.1
MFSGGLPLKPGGILKPCLGPSSASRRGAVVPSKKMNEKKKRRNKGKPVVRPSKPVDTPAAPGGAQRPAATEAAPGQAVVANAPGRAVEASAPGQAVEAYATAPVTTEEGSRKSSDKSRPMKEIEMRAMFDVTDSGTESDTSN